MALRARPFTVDDALIAADEADELWGITYTGYTAVSVYEGADNTGTLLFAGGAGPATFAFQTGVSAHGGIYVDVTGSGSGSLFI